MTNIHPLVRAYINMKDCRGNKIQHGAIVAYNRSGDVVHGTVERFGRATRFYGVSIFIRNSQDNKVSKVINPRGVLVIVEALELEVIQDNENQT